MNRIQNVITVFLLLVCLTIGGLWSAAAQETGPSESGSPSRFKTGQVLVKFKESVSTRAMASARKRYHATRLRSLYNSDVEVWQVPASQELALVKQLSADSLVAYAEPDYVYRICGAPDDPHFDKQWAHARIQSAAAWDITTGSTSTVIAIIDSGIDETHPDLASKIVAGYDFWDDDADPHDEAGHGTHCAGIAAAVTDNDTGVAGMDWQARIMPIRVLSREGIGYSSDITDGITWAYQHGAKVLSLSLSGPDYSQSMQDAINNAHAAGSLVVAAMGNERTAGNPISYPAAYGNVMAVAATGPTDTYSSYSQYGPHCDIAAPGGNMSYLHDPKGIFSTMPTYPVYMTTEYGFSQDYDYFDGTSQATPHVAGLATLIWTVAPTLTPDQVQSIIQSTADDLGPPGWDPDYGHGRINALAAVQAAGLAEPPVLSPIDNVGNEDAYQIKWSAVSSASGYTLQEDDTLSFTTPMTRYVGTALHYDVTGQPGGTWYYRVRAWNATTEGPWSTPPQSTTVAMPALPAPVLAPIDNPANDDEYLVNWTDVPTATSYVLEESGDPYFGTPTEVYSDAVSQFTVTNQLAGTWHYRVRAFGPTGKSPWSNQQATLVRGEVYLPVVVKGYATN